MVPSHGWQWVLAAGKSAGLPTGAPPFSACGLGFSYMVVSKRPRDRGVAASFFSDLTSDILEYHFRCILVAKGVSKACQPRGALWRRIRSALDGRVSVSAHYTGAGGMGGVGMVVLGKCSLPQGGRVQTNSPTKV